MTRVKGYADWNPRPETVAVLGQVQAILDEYRSYGAMTARQIFYRLVGEYGFDKTEQAYARLCEYLVRARRAEIIPFGSIRDDGTTLTGGGGWDSSAQFWRSVKHTAQDFQLDHQMHQHYEVEIWCEAAGMAPMLARMTRRYHIPVYSTGGFSSVTVTHETADRIAHRDRPTAFLHVGDFDPSGESIFKSMTEDIGLFVDDMCGGEIDGYEAFVPERVALTREQVAEFDLPTAPPKASDSRSARWIGETTQLEAMPPTLLEQVITDAVTEYIDEDTVDDVIADETVMRQRILGVIDSTGEV